MFPQMKTSYPRLVTTLAEKLIVMVDMLQLELKFINSDLNLETIYNFSINNTKDF